MTGAIRVTAFLSWAGIGFLVCHFERIAIQRSILCEDYLEKYHVEELGYEQIEC